jgi:predicted DNA-binding ribbon-helix-helix protein
MNNFLKKRSVTIARHASSVTLEQPFWEALKMIAADQGESINGLITKIDADKPTHANLSSAIRVYVLKHFQDE